MRPRCRLWAGVVLLLVCVTHIQTVQKLELQDVYNCWNGDFMRAAQCCDPQFGPLGNIAKCREKNSKISAQDLFTLCCRESLAPAALSVIRFATSPSSHHVAPCDGPALWRTAFMYLRNASVPGDYAEFGVAQGYSAMETARILLNLESLPNLHGAHLPKRRIWLFDAFGRGFPPGHERDPGFAQYLSSSASFRYGGRWSATPTEIRRKLESVGWDARHRATIVPGYFNETLQKRQHLPKSIAFLNVDVDLYESAMVVLDSLYDAVPVGGFIHVDDFGLFAGVREAFYEFCQKRSLYPLIERCGNNAAWFLKGKDHNWPSWYFADAAWWDLVHNRVHE